MSDDVYTIKIREPVVNRIQTCNTNCISVAFSIQLEVGYPWAGMLPERHKVEVTIDDDETRKILARIKEKALKKMQEVGID